jgi:hypothetical protein
MSLDYAVTYVPGLYRLQPNATNEVWRKGQIDFMAVNDPRRLPDGVL